MVLIFKKFSLFFPTLIILTIIYFIRAEIIVKIDSGYLSSSLKNRTRNSKTFHAFLGIPYAAPPINELRFEPPQAPLPWEGVRNASQFESICTQQDLNTIGIGEDKMIIIGEEDCLYLNVYTPEVRNHSLMPVIVFIHGGSFMAGSSNLYDGNNFMDHPLVLVTINYRLGVFGFISSGDEILPGNYALKDQAAALKWVHRNIAVFGGDPNSVTLMGQSSGANNVHFHTFSPMSAGYFHQAIMMSGTAFALWSYFPKKYAESSLKMLLDKTNCNQGTVEECKQCLKKMDHVILSKAYCSFVQDGVLPFLFRPVLESTSVKDAFITDDPRNLNYINPKIPILSGVCSGEGKTNLEILLQNHNGTSNLYQFVKDELPLSTSYKFWTSKKDTNSMSASILDFYFHYEKQITKKDSSKLVELFGNLLFVMPAIDFSLSYDSTRYQYVFDFEYDDTADTNSKTDLEQVPGAKHSADIKLLVSTNLSTSALKVSEGMLQYLANFAIYGNPNGNGTNSNTCWNEVESLEVDYLLISSDGFEMKIGMNTPFYSFYKSLPFKWTKIPIFYKLSNFIWWNLFVSLLVLSTLLLITVSITHFCTNKIKRRMYVPL